ncbi:hypothetical protein [Fodinibius salsisoli]|uniref:AbiTii domain-containing protein n=1 Tax=Fodinibius salsisoli TaxID=2820877 RepID=A0ABT3PT83_9BACT|nr:hypothetical protein [Fodinibius salsisoli]MCW9709073.1 hypothetical protein [Fodinibius salsisoli]
MEFEKGELEELLEANSSDRKLHGKLKIGQRYMLHCSNCFNPNNFSIEDEENLLIRFEEVFYAIQNIVEVFSLKLFEKIAEIESELNLSQNVVKLGMIDGRLRRPPRGTFSKLLLSPSHKIEIPEKGTVPLTKQLLLEIQTALARIGGLCAAASREAKEWWYSDEDVFVVEDYYDPRNVSKKYLKRLIDDIKESLHEDPNIPEKVIKKLHSELDDVTRELDKGKPSWNKIVSKVSQTVLVLAAVVTIAANLDDAYENAVKAFNYISQQSITVPRVQQSNIKDIPKLSGIKEEQENEDEKGGDRSNSNGSN